jgi:hypothetical protein
MGEIPARWEGIDAEWMGRVLAVGPASVSVKAEGQHREVHTRNGNLFNDSKLCGPALSWLSTLGTDGYQTREVSLALAERFAAAFVDLDTPAALAELGPDRGM